MLDKDELTIDCFQVLGLVQYHYTALYILPHSIKIFTQQFYFRPALPYVRVATAQGKQGIWFLLFPDRENTGNFVLTQGKIC